MIVEDTKLYSQSNHDIQSQEVVSIVLETQLETEVVDRKQEKETQTDNTPIDGNLILVAILNQNKHLIREITEIKKILFEMKSSQT